MDRLTLYFSSVGRPADGCSLLSSFLLFFIARQYALRYDRPNST